jgi:ABC-2 type transport system permease protein
VSPSRSLVEATSSRAAPLASSFATLGSSLLAGIGGAPTPVLALPVLSRRVAPITPTYWAMRGFRSLYLNGSGFGAVLLPCAVLLSAAVVCAVVVLRRFRYDAVKVS